MWAKCFVSLQEHTRVSFWQDTTDMCYLFAARYNYARVLAYELTVVGLDEAKASVWRGLLVLQVGLPW
jgi:hypothetical protein